MQNRENNDHKIPVNTFFNFSALLCQLAVSFFMAPFLVHRLGDSAYGVWAIVMSIFGYMGLLDLGVGPSLIRYVAHYDVEAKRQAMGLLLSSALLFYALAGLVGATIVVAIGVSGMTLFKIPVTLLGQARLTMALMGLGLIVRFPGSVFVSLLSGMRLYHKRRAVEIADLLVKSAAIVLAIRAGKGLVWLAIITVCGDSLRFIFIFLVAKSHLRGTKVGIRNAKRKYFHQLCSYGLKVFATVVLRTVSLGSDCIIIGIILSSRWVTFFSIPFMLLKYLRAGLASLTLTLMPVFSNLQSQNLVSDIRVCVLRYSRYAAAMGLFAGTAVIVFGEPFLRLWMGPAYASRGGAVLTFLCLSFMMMGLVACSETLFMGTGKQHVLLSAAAVHSPIRLGLTIALIYPLGIKGVALAEFACQAGVNIYLAFRVCEYLGTRMRDYGRQALLRPVLAAGAAGFLLWSIKESVYPRSLPQLMAEVVIGCAVCLPLAAMIVLTQDERKAVLRFVKRRFLRRRGKQRDELPMKPQASADASLGS